MDPRFLMGKGRLTDLVIQALQLGSDLLVFDAELTPAQVRSITDFSELRVIDRTQLILDLFAQRARTREGKLQVEMAQVKYLLPRLGAGTTRCPASPAASAAGVRGRPSWKSTAGASRSA
jgi:GTPase